MNYQNLRKDFDITNAAVGFCVWLVILVVYTLTKAPTLSFWDCGEFIAASSILGVPHPPGTPLYVLIGRLFALIPTSADIAVRVNMLSVVSSSFTALFSYLVAVRVLRSWFDGTKTGATRLLIYGGGAAGAFFIAFGLTNWNNSVETEVYGLAMMLIMAILWLTLIYVKNRSTALGNGLLLLIMYLGFVGIGIHMTTFLIIPVVVLFFILKDTAGPHTWFAVATFFALELYMIFALSSRPGEIPYYLPVAIVFIFYLFFVFSFEKIPRLYMYVLAGFLFAIFPLYGNVYELVVNGSKGVLSTDASSTLSLVGYVAYGGLILFALFCLFKYLSVKKKTGNEQYLVVSLFILAAAVATVILYFVKGYSAFLVLTAAAGLVLLLVTFRHVNWSILLAVLAGSLVMIGVYPFLYGMAVAAVVILIMGLFFKLPDWKIGLMILVVAALGFSVNVYTPVRSARQPIINMNNPSKDLATTVAFLERKQYGSVSMVERMFTRRSEWSNQFGMHRRMGFWGFFSEQYGFNGPKFVILFLIGVFGIWEIVRRRPKLGLPLLIMLLISSVGLVLYMNFADGTRQNMVTGRDYLEVRDRDYFFTPAFIFFGMAIGCGLSILIQFIRESVASIGPAVHKVALYATPVILILPLYALAHNYPICDRSNNYTAFDYGWNILASAEENAILITSGDNDTFPIWCLQEAYGIRKDVKNVNLSLANMKWYMKQVKNNLGVNLGWSETDIDNLRPIRLQDGTVLRFQDQVVNAIIENNLGRVPINFAVTVSSGARKYWGKNIDSLLVLRAMVFSMAEHGQKMTVDRDMTVGFYTDSTRFLSRGVDDPSVYKDEVTFRLTKNYANAMLMVADEMRKEGDLDGAEKIARVAVEKIPYAPDAVTFLAALYAEQGDTEKLKELLAATGDLDTRRIQVMLARAEAEKGNVVEAERIFVELLTADPSYRSAFDELMRLYYRENQIGAMRQLLQTWLRFNPADERIRTLLKELDKEISRQLQTTEQDSQ